MAISSLYIFPQRVHLHSFKYYLYFHTLILPSPIKASLFIDLRVSSLPLSLVEVNATLARRGHENTRRQKAGARRQRAAEARERRVDARLGLGTSIYGLTWRSTVPCNLGRLWGLGRGQGGAERGCGLRVEGKGKVIKERQDEEGKEEERVKRW